MKIKKMVRPVIIISLVALTMFGYYQVPKFETVEATSVVEKSVIKSEVDYTITANQETTLWAAGENLEKGMPLYYYALKPGLTVYPALSINNPDSGEIKVDLHLGNVDKEGNYYWKKLIKNQQTGKVTIGNKDLKPLEIDVMEILEMTNSIDEELNSRRGSSGTNIILVSINAVIGEELLKHDIVFTLGSSGVIPPADEDLVFRKEIAEEVPYKQLERRTLSDYLECSYFWSYLGGISLLFMSGFYTFSKEPKNTYKRYDKWVSKAALNTDKKPDAYFDSLKELIDTAVELDKKVIFDSNSDTYYILDGSNLYAHEKSNNRTMTRRGRH